jgi:FtsZ-interacting cell division protein ZipA
MRFFIALVLVGLIFVALWRGWFRVSLENDQQQSETSASVTVNKEKIEKDLNNIREQGSNATRKTPSQSEQRAEPKDDTGSATTRTKIEGKVQELGADRLILATSSGQKLRVDVTPETSVRVGPRPGQISDLRLQDPVTVTYMTRNGKNVAIAIAKD